ncbi:inorganic phosphate transporter [bacterium]|nr:inorganic phosphate transporter [bacterium]
MQSIFFDFTPDAGTLALLVLAVAFALFYQAVNGFHDTANAVATVVYTRSMRATPAVVLSGFCNLVGVLLSGVGVAYAIVNLLPVELIVGETHGQFAVVFAVLTGALIWNLGTWYLGIPASSSHTLIGSVLGVGLTHAWMSGQGAASGLRWSQVYNVFTALLMSPLIGFAATGLMLILLKRTVKNPRLFEAPKGEDPPPTMIRALIIGSCAGVSFAHGSNDGQKGMGLMMLILMGIAPFSFSVNMQATPAQVRRVVETTIEGKKVIETHLAAPMPSPEDPRLPEEERYRKRLREIVRDMDGAVDTLQTVEQISQVPGPERFPLRKELLVAYRSAYSLRKSRELFMTPEEFATMKTYEHAVRDLIEYVSGWVKVSVALALGFGTMIGWKRVAVTVGEKIGNQPMTYAQGLSAQVVAMLTIGAGDILGLPVSTTHVLSSGVAGSMVANGSGLQRKTLLNIMLAWVLTLPASMALSAVAYLIFRQF